MKPTTIDRQELLRQLESVTPGLSSREIIEQSSCFVFSEGEVITYNDEVACRLKTNMKITGAVQAKPLLSILQKLVEDALEVSVEDGELLLVGKKRRAGIRMDKKIYLPIKNVEKPKKWKPLHEDFTDAVQIVHECAGRDESKFWITCVHIHPKWVEACDEYQISRYKLPTGVESPILVRSDSIKHLVALEMKELCESESWIHFRNETGLVLSCRRYVETFPDLAKLLKVTGSPTTLPKGLGDATDKAAVFSSENTDNNQVHVELRPGKLRIKGIGVSGWYSEVKKLKYNGPAMSFMIAPGLLSELCKRHHECEIAQERLKVDGGKWVYLACLEQAGKETDQEGAEEVSDDDAEQIE